MLMARTGVLFAIPYLVDPNRAIEMFEGQEIIKYLRRSIHSVTHITNGATVFVYVIMNCHAAYTSEYTKTWKLQNMNFFSYLIIFST